MSYRLFLDDIRNPADVKWIQLPLAPWVIVRKYEDFVKVIEQRGLPEFIAFDHDLADEHYPFNEPKGGIAHPKTIPYDDYKEKTGFHAAKWLVDYCLDNDKKLPMFVVHSMNRVGSENITSLLNNFKRFQSQ